MALSRIDIPIPLYKTGVIVAVGGDEQDVEALVKEVHDHERSVDVNLPSGLQPGGRTFRKDGYWQLVWVKEVKAPIMAHELLHVVQAILVPRGLEFTPDADEAFCYLLEYLMEMVEENLDYLRSGQDPRTAPLPSPASLPTSSE